MSKMGKLFGIFSRRSGRDQDWRREPGLAKTHKRRDSRELSLAAGDWQAIKDDFQAKVRGLVSKLIVESMFSDGPRVDYQNREVLLQAAANRLYADALYSIASTGVTKRSKPSRKILKWAEEALDEALANWQRQEYGSEDGDYEPSMREKRSITDAIYAALEQASGNDVLFEAAKQRVQSETEMVAAE